MPSILTRILRRAGRLLEPLLAPDAEEQRRRAERLTTLAKEQATAIRALGEQVTAARSDVQRVRELRASDVEEARGSVADLKTGMRRQGAALARLARTTGMHAQLEWTEQRVIDPLSRIASSGRPVFVSPMTGEHGFALLSYIPICR